MIVSHFKTSATTTTKQRVNACFFKWLVYCYKAVWQAKV